MNGNRVDYRNVARQTGDVAIIGMSCMFSNAGDLRTYWSNILNKHVAIGDIPEGRRHAEWHDNASVGMTSRHRVPKGASLGDHFEFDPVGLRVPPSSITGADPDQFLVLRCAHEALVDAGFRDADLGQHRAEVIIGRAASDGPGTLALRLRTEGADKVVDALLATNPNMQPAELSQVREELVAALPPFGAETVPGVVPNIVAGRIANRFNCMGVNFTVDAACATGLVAAELAIRNLLSRVSDVAVVGAVHADINVGLMTVFDTLGAISRDGVCRPFDVNTDGTVLGEGVGVLVLKRVEDAARDGDRIYAVIKGIGSASDGKSTALLSPSSQGEKLAIERAYAASGVSPDSVELIEAHGTGTEAGDRTELEVIHNCFVSAGRTRPLALGSVKSMIGHTLAAAGVASLIKTALALYQRTLPPTANCESPQASLRESRGPVYVNTEARPWMRGHKHGPRRAGVSAFGFGGVNAHAVLEEYEEDREVADSMYRRWPAELLVVEANSHEALVERVETLAGEAGRTRDLAQLASVVNSKVSLEKPGSRRLAVVASDVADLGNKLWRVAKGLDDPDVASINDRSGIYYQTLIETGKLALIFPGEGSPYPNAARELVVAFPSVHGVLERFDDLGVRGGAEPVMPSLYSPPACGAARHDAEQDLMHPYRSAPAARAVDLAMLHLVRSLGIEGAMACGHSAGEWVALAATGMVDDDAIATLHGAVGECFAAMSDIPPVAVFAVRIAESAVDSLGRKSGCSLLTVNDNCPHQVVLAVSLEEEARFVDHCRAARIIAEKLPFDRPFHSEHYAGLAEPLRSAFSTLGISPPRIPTYSCTAGSQLPANGEDILDLISTAPARPVLFTQTVEQMYSDGARIFVEVGPRAVLTGFVDDILAGKPHHAVSLDGAGRGGIAGLLHGLGRLAALGVPMDLRLLHEVRGIKPNQATRGRTNLVSVSLARSNLATDRLTPPRSSAPDMSSMKPGPDEADVGGGGLQGRASTAMEAYFETMETFVSSQESVMDAFFSSREQRGRE